MVVVSYSGKEINAKLVYYGCGLCGKTTNLEAIYEAVPDNSRGKMVSMKTQSDRTLFFDLLPLDLGEIMGFKTRFLLYTVPGQVFYNATRKLVLKGADAIVFVADSEVGKMEENKESLANLQANLAEYSVNLEQLPWVIQYNKRDLPNVYSIEELNAELNPTGRMPFFEAAAKEGKGVFETFRGISHLLMEKVTKDLRRTPFTGAAKSAEPAPVPKTEAPRVPQSLRPMTPAPLSPASAIAHEAQETPGPLVDSPVGSLDYGREIELPTGIPPAAPAEVAPAPSAPSQVMARPTAPPPKSAASVSATLRSAVEARVARTAAPAAAPPPEPVRIASAPPERTPAPNNGPSQQIAVVNLKANSGSTEPVVVPVHVTRDGSCELVIRIVITEDKAA